MNKLSRKQRQKNFFDSIDRIKEQLNAKPKKKGKSRPRALQALEKIERDKAQLLYNEQQQARAEALARAEAEQLRKELMDLVKKGEIV